jgi:disulfide bond formation protein DsbB
MSFQIKHTFDTFLTPALTTKWYWGCLALLGVAMEAVALYYQYVLGDEPCQVCIHIRIWVAAFTLLAVLMLILPKHRLLNLLAHSAMLGCMIGFFERSKYLYDVEMGRGDGSCEFFLGFPEWFALDKWLPFIFEVRNLCGFTPDMVWGLSMSESLLSMSVGLIVISALALILNSLKALKN